MNRSVTRDRRPGSELLFVCVALLSSQASAQTSVHLTGSATAAYTDNALGAPSDPGPGQAGPIATPFFLLTPGGILFHDARRSRYLLGYERHFAFLLKASENDSAADMLTAQGVFLLSPRDTLTLSLYATHSSFAGLLLDSTRPGVSEPRTGYQTERFRADLTEGYNRQLSERWQLIQSSSFGVVTPLGARAEEPFRYRIGTGLGVEHSDGRTSYGLLGGATYFRAVALEEEVQVETEQAALFEARARVRRDFGSYWSSELFGGLGLSHDLERRSALSPIFGAALHFGSQAFQADLRYGHQRDVHLESFEILESDEGALNFVVPLSRLHPIRFFGANTFARSRSTDLDEERARESVYVWMSEARLEWQGDWYALGARYQHFQQFGAGPGALRLPNMSRDVVMLTLSGMIPPRRLAPVPIAPPRRVDGTAGAAPAPE